MCVGDCLQGFLRKDAYTCCQLLEVWGMGRGMSGLVCHLAQLLKRLWALPHPQLGVYFKTKIFFPHEAQNLYTVKWKLYFFFKFFCLLNSGNLQNSSWNFLTAIASMHLGLLIWKSHTDTDLGSEVFVLVFEKCQLNNSISQPSVENHKSKTQIWVYTIGVQINPTKCLQPFSHFCNSIAFSSILGLYRWLLCQWFQKALSRSTLDDPQIVFSLLLNHQVLFQFLQHSLCHVACKLDMIFEWFYFFNSSLLLTIAVVSFSCTMY